MNKQTKRCCICGLEDDGTGDMIFYAHSGNLVKCPRCEDLRRIQIRNHRLPGGFMVNRFWYEKRLSEERGERWYKKPRESQSIFMKPYTKESAMQEIAMDDLIRRPEG